MPELPEVEAVARSLRPRLVGRTVEEVRASGKRLRRPVELKKLKRALEGARVLSVERRGKYLLVAFSSEEVVLAHLGMTGRMVFAERAAPFELHTHVIFRLDEELDLRFVDPRRFGVLKVYPAARVDQSDELKVLGLDPLQEAFDVEYLRAALKGSKRDLKSFLLDQGVVAGLGNIYVCEALFRAGLSPRRRAFRVTAERAAALHRAIREVLELGIQNRGTSFSDYVDADGNFGDNQAALLVYGREGEPCPHCGKAIRRVVQGARSSFFCGNCQKYPK
jgi:formamidopyrimidine-DNA glycosylase